MDCMHMLIRNHMNTRLYVILMDEMTEKLPDEDSPIYLHYLKLRKRLRHYAGRKDEDGWPTVARWVPAILSCACSPDVLHRS
ncbi:hypothetical protein TKK_0010323 [Trichogramma kaykai]|uniref:Uncharacterized protein n=1 Tax=Trichogramma kaykai TaxID=54128 RepID=A0ABD2WWL4_9HYME